MLVVWLFALGKDRDFVDKLQDFYQGTRFCFIFLLRGKICKRSGKYYAMVGSCNRFKMRE